MEYYEHNKNKDEARRAWAVEQAKVGVHGADVSGAMIVDAAQKIEAYVKGNDESAAEA